jgi:hypothetical protein
VFEPLPLMVRDAANSDPGVAERLALVDALRSCEGPRVRVLAEGLLKERIDLEAGLLRDCLRSK